jgi:hypothetical protein
MSRVVITYLNSTAVRLDSVQTHTKHKQTNKPFINCVMLSVVIAYFNSAAVRLVSIQCDNRAQRAKQVVGAGKKNNMFNGEKSLELSINKTFT